MKDKEFKMARFAHAKDVKPHDFDLDRYISSVKDGFTQDLILQIRQEADKTKRNELKAKLPAVTPSCVFNGTRSKSNVSELSGIIVIDIDNVEDVREVRERIQKDKYTFVSNISASGNGLCVFVQIPTKDFSGSFRALERYYFENYGIVIDKACKDECRLRYISYDPEIFVNDKAQKFSLIEKEIDVRKHEKVIFVKNDFEQLVKDVQDRGIDLSLDDYQRYLALGFALSEHFGEQGRDYFHVVCQSGSKYKYREADKQFSACLKARGHGISISTFYHYCKEAGLKMYSQETVTIIQQATRVKRGGGKKEAVYEHLAKFEDIKEADASPIIEQIFNSNFDFAKQVLAQEDKSETAQLLEFVLREFELKKNLVTRRLEQKDKIIEDSDLNTFYIDTKIAMPFNFARGDFDSIIFSTKIPSYNPILKFFKENDYCFNPNKDLIKELSDTILARNHHEREFNHVYIKKWLVGMIATMLQKDISPLVLVLCGDVHGTGKTEWFRRLLPQDLQYLYGESKLDAGKDDEILMTQKILIMDDEFGGKSKELEKRFKEITSKKVFNLREPYGRMNVDLNRLATLCGTSNELQILSDPTGNRRLLPILVERIDHNLYNSIDKKELFIQAYREFLNGFNYTILREDMESLGLNKKEFEAIDNLEELFFKYFAIELESDFMGYKVELTNTDILTTLWNQSQLKVGNSKRLGAILQHHKVKQNVKKVNGKTVRVYEIYKLGQIDNQQAPF